MAQGQSVMANRRVRGGADGQDHLILGGAGDSGTPAGSINGGRQIKGGPGAILVGGLRTCVEECVSLEP